MKLLLVNPPNGRFDRTYLAPPLGLLTLAAAVRQQGHEAHLLDLNLEVLADSSFGGEELYDRAFEMIARVKPDAVGFTSMCLESHVSLKLAQRIKSASPEVITIFGGTHFGAIARELLENFDFVDFVVSGEAEHALQSILDGGLKGSPKLPTNTHYRHEGGVRSGLIEQVRPSMEDLPFPAYDLADLDRYFSLNPARLLNYEAGRGCVFKCSFCYSPFQYGDAVRNKNPERVVEDLRKLSRLGARHVFFVQDNLLNSPRWASDLCWQVAAADLPLTWECYATYPQLKDSLIDSLAEAGCKGIFTGIDAVAHESQERLNKPFLRDWEAVSRKLARCLERGIQPLCAFILEEPEQDQKKNEAAITTALRCVGIGCEVHLNTLSIYNHTALDGVSTPARFSYSSAKVELLMDAPEVVRVNDFAKRLPQLFPYHCTTSDVRLWEGFVAKVHTLSTLVAGLRRTLSRYVVEEGNSIWKCLDYIDSDFAAWMASLEPQSRRKAAVLEFNRHFASQNISQETLSLLGREVAGVILSEKHAGRFVNLVVDSAEETYRLAWFINLQNLRPSKVGKARRASPHVKALHSDDHSRPSGEIMLALLSQNETIRIFSAPPELAELLQRLADAAALNQRVRLSGAQLEGLKRGGWIWPSATYEPAEFSLDNSG